MKKFIVALMLCFVSILGFATEETTCVLNGISGDFSKVFPASYIIRTDDNESYSSAIINLPTLWQGDVSYSIGQLNMFVNTTYQADVLIPFQYSNEHDNYNAVWQAGEYRLFMIYYQNKNMLVIALSKEVTK